MTIFLVETNGDVSVYPSAEAAGTYMETPDILDGEYVCAYDEEGNVFSISTQPVSEGIDLIVGPGILIRTGKKDPSGLHEALKLRFATDHSGAPLSLDELISRAIADTAAREAAAAKRTGRILRTIFALLVIIAVLYALG